MTGRRFGRATVVVACVAAAAVAAAAVWLFTRDSGGGRSAPVEITPPPSGMVVDLERLGIGDSAVPEGTVVPLVVSVAAQAPLAAIELWAGTTLVERRELTDGPTSTRAAFDWPATAGDTTLSARTIDTAGRTALSGVVRLRAGGPPRLSTLAEYTIAAGDTLESIAAAHATSAQLIALANPGVFQPGETPAGTTIQIPVEVPFPAGAQPSGGPPRPARPARPAAPPPFAVSVDGCSASVAPPADTTGITGMAAHLLPADGNLFDLVASGPAKSTLTFAVPAAPALLVVGTFGGGVQTMGPPQPIAAAPGCTEGWSGAMRLAGSRLVGNVDADTAYLYLSTGSGWDRVPATGSVDRSQTPDGTSGFDFAGVLPDLSSREIDLEAWGRKGGALVFLGNGEFRAAAPLVPSAQHLRTQLWWIKTPDAGGQPEVLATGGFVPNPGELRFRWKASSPAVTKAVWQVTAYQVPATAGIDIPGVIAQDVVAGAQAVFPIDFSPFAGKPPVSTASASAALGPMALVAGAVQGPAPPADSVATPPVVVGSGGPVLKAGGQVVGTIPPPTRFYVRLVPFVGDQPAGRGSNTVAIDTKLDVGAILGGGPIVDEPGPNVYGLSLTVLPPHAPDPWYAKCWRITGIDPSKFDPAYDLINKGWQVFVSQVGNVVCPICYKTGNWQFDYAGYYGWHCSDDGGFDLGDPSTWDEFPILGPLVTGLFQAGTSIWDFAVELATYLKAKVVDLVSLVGCETFVNAGSAAAGSKPPGQAQGWCHDLAEIAVDAALISAGIPPTLPTYAEAMKAAKGKLVDLIVEQASALGIPCEEAAAAGQVVGNDTLTCEALASAVLDQVVETAKAAVSASAAAVSGIYFPPGVYAVPHEKGQVTPGFVTITVTPTPQAPVTGTTCAATVVMSSTYTPPDTAFGQAKLPDLNVGFAKNYGMGSGIWVTSQPYGGFVIQPTSITLPKLTSKGGQLQPAASAFILGQLSSHDTVSAYTFWGNGQASPALHLQIPYESLQLHPGATVTTSVHAACAKDVTVIGTVLPGGGFQVTKVIP